MQRCRWPLKVPDLGISPCDSRSPLLPVSNGGWSLFEQLSTTQLTGLTLSPSHLHSKGLREHASEEVKLLRLPLQLQLVLGTDTSAQAWPPCRNQWVCDNHICKVSCPGSFVVSSREFKETSMRNKMRDMPIAWSKDQGSILWAAPCLRRYSFLLPHMF